jgi:ABC-type glycerol-3-phosphate transport system substrate-binding protein
MRSLTCLAGLVLVMLLGATACAGSSSFEAVGDCLVKAKVIFWGGSQWVDLAKALAADPSECAEYYISIPPGRR